MKILTALNALGVVTIIIILVCKPTTFDLNSFLSAIGAIVSAVAFLFGGYFALLAVNAYSHVRDIESKHSSIIELHNSIELASDNAKNTKLQFDILYNDTSCILFDASIRFLEDRINFLLDDSSSMIKEELRPLIEHKVNSLNRQIALIALKYNMLKFEIRQGFINKLFSVGIKEDVKILKDALANESDDDAIYTIKVLVAHLENAYSAS